MADNVIIDYTRIINSIRDQFALLQVEIKNNASLDNPEEIFVEAYNLTRNLSIIVDDEQSYIKEAADPNKVYIVVKFGAATTYIGNSVCNVSLVVWGNENAIKPAQVLLGLYVAKYNLTLIGTSSTQQIWNTPSVMSNFTVAGKGFRSLFSVAGTLIISQDAMQIGELTYIPDDAQGEEDYVTVPIIGMNDTFQTSMNPQAFGNTHGFTDSEAKFSTGGISISTYFLNNRFVRDLLEVKGMRDRALTTPKANPKTPNSVFKLRIKYFFGSESTPDFYYTNYPKPGEASETDSVIGSDFFMEYKVVSISISKQIGQTHSISVGLTH